MMNERKTESIVRSHFEKFKDIVHVEEQISDDLRIDKLLKNASKKGSGKGKPEFLITFKKNLNFLVVVECKADISKHESSTKDKYSDFAVDGALLYASFLSREFDVLAVAVSGETKQSLKVSHFLHLKNETKAISIFGNGLLSPDDYLEGYLKSPEKFKQDYDSLLEFTKKLNEKLHSYKILESQRSLLISCILIALEDEAFKSSYEKKSTPKSLADFLTKTVSEKLEEANISGQKLHNLNIQFGFIRTDTSLSTKEKVLVGLIKEIDENINQFIKTHEYFDVLGQLYIEFLRYANSDKGLGIVLTPPHITELFTELAQVDKNSIVLDNCTGTGGFLIAAMKKMIKDAQGDLLKISEIKSNQLIGIEYQSHIFALAVSNMYIHQDGKTNIINGSCFDDEITKAIKAKKPTIGLLNPPYKSDKKNDTNELEFVLNNLDCLEQGGRCVAIVPMSTALAQKGTALELKKKLMEQHTLEAVLSMPDELFFNSNVGVVSCIMIFTAKKPHSKNYKTYFGRWKNDGFVKRKNKGRVEGNNWSLIREKWLDSYRNRESIPGLSVTHLVSPEDEWCSEAYLRIDTHDISKRMFIDSALEYLSFLALKGDFKGLNNFISQNYDGNVKREELEKITWRDFIIKDYFEVYRGLNIPVETNNLNVGTPVISAITINNGFSHYSKDLQPLYPGNCITIGNTGQASVGVAFYQPYPFIATNNVNILKPKAAAKINEYIGIFLVTMFKRERYKFSFGRVLKRDRTEQMKISLPEKNEIPDWEFMENYIKTLPFYEIT